MNVLMIVNDAPYGSEKAYNACRLAMTLQREQADVVVQIFPIADAVTCAPSNQTTPQGYHNVERMLRSILTKGGQIKAWCGSCVEARGLKRLPLLEGIEISRMSQLATWVVAADRVVTF